MKKHLLLGMALLAFGGGNAAGDAPQSGERGSEGGAGDAAGDRAHGNCGDAGSK